MSSGLALNDSRIAYIELADEVATIQFSLAYIHKSKGKPGRDSGTSWSQEAQLMLWAAAAAGPLPSLPNTISAGFLEVGGIRHEVIPLPFKRRVGATLFLEFVDGSHIEIVGQRPVLELLGDPIYLGDIS